MLANTINKSSRAVNIKVSCFAVILYSLFMIPNATHAALILQAPKYIGLNNGLVGYWSFNGADMAGVTAYDRSGNNNNGTLTNGPFRVEGKLGQALSFDGVNDYVTTSNGNSVKGLSQFTFSAWIKLNAIGLTQQIYSEARNTTAGASRFQITMSSTNRINISVQIPDSASSIVLMNNGTGTFSTNTWYHFVFVFNSNAPDYTFYTNGALTRATSTNSVGTFDNTNPFNIPRIGATNFGTPTQFFNGSIDDVRVYNRALSADEIKRLYRIGGTLHVNTQINNDSLSKGLVGWWSFDGKDIVGVTAYDRSGNANNGTLTNSPVRTVGKIGQAVSLDGADDSVNAGSGSTLDDLTVKTISIWFMKRGDSGGNLNLITKGVAAGGGGWQLSVGVSNNNKINYFHEWSTSANSSASWASTSLIATGVWYHLVFIYDASSSANNPLMYLNGQADTMVLGSAPSGTEGVDAANSLLIGDLSGTPHIFNGYVDDVRIYNRALSKDEIKRLYRIGATLKVNTSINNDSLTKGLVGYWSFDGKDMAGVIAFDRSGNANNGTLVNGPFRAIGKIGQALNFDGVNSYVSLPDMGTVETYPFTFSAWFKTSVGDVDQFLVGQYNSGDPPTQRVIFNYTDTTTKFVYNVRNGADEVEIGPSSLAQDGTWHHAVGVSAASNDHKMYLDGVLITSSTTNVPAPTVDRATIGDWQNPFAAFTDTNWNGSIDDVRIYNRALTPSEIQRLYNLGR